MLVLVVDREWDESERDGEKVELEGILGRFL